MKHSFISYDIKDFHESSCKIILQSFLQDEDGHYTGPGYCVITYMLELAHTGTSVHCKPRMKKGVAFGSPFNSTQVVTS